MEWGLAIISALIVFFIVAVALIIAYAENKLFDPTHDEVWEPPVTYSEIRVGDVHGWHINIFPNRPVVLYCHGNNDNITHREYVYLMCECFQYNLVLFDYCGYGKSEGKPSQKQILKDGGAVYEWMLTKHSPDNIIVWGESLGGAVACHVASNYKCRSLVLFSTFSSLHDIAFRGDLYSWWVKGMVGLVGFFIDTMPTKNRVNKIEERVLIVHSSEDDVIHLDNAKILFESIKHDNKGIVQIRGGHSSPIMQPLQFLAMYRFLEGDNQASLDPRRVAMLLEKVKASSTTLSVEIPGFTGEVNPE